jgi:hypothetical protein
MAAMALSMIVEMTSLTPRVVRRMPAMPAQAAPTNMATSRVAATLRKPGSRAAPAKVAARYDASPYWPSTPMLNRPIRNPIAAATAER